MMYRCCECGHLFEDGDQAQWEETHGFSSPPHEKWDGCPMCNGDYEEIHQCKGCDEWHTENELYDGWCEKCLRETINYDTFFKYCEANKDENYLDLFVMKEFFDAEMPKYSSYAFHDLMIRVYCERVSSIKVEKSFFGKSLDEFLAACIRFIMDDDGAIGREHYANWLNKREVK